MSRRKPIGDFADMPAAQVRRMLRTVWGSLDRLEKEEGTLPKNERELKGMVEDLLFTYREGGGR